LIVAGLTGGIATGKSTVAAMFASLGAAIVDADRIGHALQEPGRPCHRAIVASFGPGVLDAEGRIDRRRLGALVFADAEARARLEAIMHPAIREACQAEIRAAAAAGRALCLVDAALILESGQRGRYETIVLVTAPEEAQGARLAATRGLTAAEARQRIQAQWPAAAKVALADFVIDNGGELSATRDQVVRLYALLTEKRSETPKNA
jgi:dephospho-CoA kinase